MDFVNRSSNILQQVVELNGYVIILVEGRDGKIKLVSYQVVFRYIIISKRKSKIQNVE